MKNADNARRLVKSVVPALGKRRSVCSSGCHNALDNALITAPDARDPELMKKLEAVAGRVL
jgi:5'-methylthioadenosine phosphorylase